MRNATRYFLSIVIKSFRHGGLQDFWETGSQAGIQARMARRLRIRLSVLDQAGDLNDVRLPGYDLHELKGNRKGEGSISVTGNWRVVFRMDAPNEVTIVNLEDYH